MLQRVKERAKTYIHKHGYGHSKEQGEEEDHDELEEEDGKENTEGEKKEKAEDLNSNFSSRSYAGSAVSPALDASSAPVEMRGQQEVPTTPVNRRNEALENEYYGKDKAEKSDYNDAFPRAPKDPEGMMKSINEESAVETVQNREAAKDRWYDADDTVAGAPTVKDQNPNLSHLGTTEPISDKLEDADQDKLGDKEIRALEDEESYKEKIHDTTSTEYGTNVASKRGNDEQQSIHEPPYEPDRMAKKENYENSEEGKSYRDQLYDKDPTEEGKSYGDQIYDIDPTEKIEPSSKFGHGEHQEPGQEETEKRTERYGDQIYDIDPTEKTELPSKFRHGEHQEPGQMETETTEPISDELEDADQDKLGDKEIRALEDDESYKEKIHDTTSTEYGTNVASKRGNDEQQSIHESPYEPDRMAEKENYENSEEGKSYGDQIYDKDPTEEELGQEETEKRTKRYGDQIYDIDPTEKTELPSKFGHGEHQEPGQEETETTEPISDELEDADQDKLSDKEIRGPAGLSDEPQASKALQEASSEEFNENVG
eukprot:PITA_11520